MLKFLPAKLKVLFCGKVTSIPGTDRNYWIYVPTQYDPAKATCSIIVQDGLGRANGWKLPTTMDSLIDENTIPPIIGIFIDHGKVSAADTSDYPRFNRSFEYDALGDRYARFLIEEIIPEVKKKYNLSDDPNDRSLAGASSGAICAFNAAWERPDAFRRVLSTIGTYVGLRGADQLSTLVRKTEPKPLRVFLEDGYNDLNNYTGDWYIANQQMLSALTWAGYEVNHSFGEGAHNSEHAAKIMREALTWLWKDYPSPIQTHVENYQGENLIKDQGSWQELITNVENINKAVCDSKGTLSFISETQPGIYRLNEEDVINHIPGIRILSDLNFDPKDQLIVTDGEDTRIITTDRAEVSSLYMNFSCTSIETTLHGFYFSKKGENQIGYYDYAQEKTNYFETPGVVTGICLNTEQSFLNLSLQDEVFGYSYKINSDKSLTEGQAYIHYHIPYGEKTAQPGAAVIDSSNFLYTATNMGVQVSDQIGKVHMILPTPHKTTSDISWGGKDLNTLYIISGGKLYFRRLNTKGKLPIHKPSKPGKPRL
ncbi:MAG: gluconolactonase [Saprospiraceae bacterium]|nr:gluconolactonase [Saprospiraceae bacterium]